MIDRLTIYGSRLLLSMMIGQRKLTAQSGSHPTMSLLFLDGSGGQIREAFQFQHHSLQL